MSRYLPCLSIIILLLCPVPSRAQLSVRITATPDYTPIQDTLYLTGTFNNWDPADDRFRFNATGGGTYAYDFATPMPDFSFKITRGSWATVEGGPAADPIENRHYVNNGATSDTIRLTVASWEDLFERLDYLDSLHLRVTAIPENTPPDARLYVTGSFNGWSPLDENYQLTEQPDGSFTATIPLRDSLTEYKISRGSWAAVESRANGLALPNRTYELANQQDRFVVLRVANWEDLAGAGLSFYSLVLLLSALQFLLLLIALLGFRARVPRANRLLAAAVGLCAVALAARVGAFDKDVFRVVPKLLLLPDVLYFALPPLALLFLRTLSKPEGRPTYWIFLPLLLATLAYLPLLFRNEFAFTSQVVTEDLRPFFSGAAGVGFLFAVTCWTWARAQVRSEVEPAGGAFTQRFQTSFLRALAVPLASWGLAVASGGIDRITDRDLSLLTDGLVDASWLFLGLLAYVIAYYFVRYPGIFRRIFPPAPRSVFTPKPLPTEDHSEALRQLNAVMTTQQPYLNAGLSLAQLASLVDVPSHQLSRTINEGTGKNFFDYVNAHRIEAFKERIRAGEHAQRTILSIALAVGFNSKTAFNRAFKKATGLTPRQFMHNAEK
ncbi:MAG: helix-turn-helix domain-containing protein [Bacteroidota bacterium]